MKLTALLLFAPITAFAGIDQDLAKIRALLAPGTDVAKLAAHKLLDGVEHDDSEIAKSGYLIRDFDKNGQDDILVIAEVNPKLVDQNTNKPCAKLDYSAGCVIEYGARSLLVFMNGEKQPSIDRRDLVLGADEGGVFGEPLNGLTVNSRGSVILSFYGGSAMRWHFSYTLQYRNGDFYHVGMTSGYSNSLDLSYTNKDHNLITGLVIETWSKGEGSRDLKKTYRVAKKPLVKLRDMPAYEL